MIKHLEGNYILGIDFIASNDIVVNPKFRTALFAENGMQQHVKLASSPIASVE